MIKFGSNLNAIQVLKPNWCLGRVLKLWAASKQAISANPKAEHTSCEVSPKGWETFVSSQLSHDRKDKFVSFPQYTILEYKTRET